jgi:hypothetical protein
MGWDLRDFGLLSLTAYCTSSGVNTNMQHWWGNNDRAIQSIWRMCHSAKLSAKNPTWLTLRLNPGLHGEKLKQSTSTAQILTIWIPDATSEGTNHIPVTKIYREISAFVCENHVWVTYTIWLTLSCKSFKAGGTTVLWKCLLSRLPNTLIPYLYAQSYFGLLKQDRGNNGRNGVTMS